MSNIPIFRAKGIHTDKYIKGLLSKAIIGGNEAYFIENWEKHRIDITTLSIHFPDMLDSQGNKIFASLQEDGKGGDILQSRGYKSPCIFNKGFTVRTVVGVCNFYMLADSLKVIGIQE